MDLKFKSALPIFELSIERYESGEILAQRPPVERGGPKGKISKLS